MSDDSAPSEGPSASRVSRPSVRYLSAIRDSLLAMEDGWNSYNAKAPTPIAIGRAMQMDFVPTTQGGIQVEWHNGRGETVIEFDAEGNVCSVGWDRG